MTNEPLLEIKSLAKHYEGFALQDISFELPRGYIMGLIGPNGAGKTTILKSILDLVTPSAGEIRIFGQDHRCTDSHHLRQRIGFVQDTPTFYGHLKLHQMKQVIAGFYARWDEEEFQRLTREFTLPLDKKIDALSRGTLMRFAISLCLSHHAELVIMDEPTTGLDPAMRRDFLDLLAAAIGDGTASVLFSTHITSDLEKTADFITFVRRGQLVFCSDRDEIMENWGVVKGGLDALTPDLEEHLRGTRRRDFGFEALTPRRRDLAARYGENLVVEKASLEDIMTLMCIDRPEDERPC